MIFNMVCTASAASSATLTVTTLANVTVTVSKDDKTYTKSTDSSGQAVFKGLEEGTWRVAIPDGN